MKRIYQALLVAVAVMALGFAGWVTVTGDLASLNIQSILALLVAPVAIAVWSITLIFRDANRQKWFLLILATIITALFILEAVLSAQSFAKGLSNYRRAPGEKKAEAVLRLRKNGFNAYPSALGREIVEKMPERAFPSKWGPLFPLGGISGVTTVQCNEDGEFSVYDSDEYGFRNPKGIWQANRADVAILGASFANGACETEKDTIAGILRREYGTVLNGARGGVSPLYSMAVLREFIAPLKPHLVLWLVQGDAEMSKLALDSNYPILMRYLDKSFTQNLTATTPFLDAQLKKWVDNRINLQARKAREKREKWVAGWSGWLKWSFSDIMVLRKMRYKLGIWRKYIPLTFYLKKNGDRTYDFDLVKRIFTMSNALIKGWGGKLVLVMLPAYEDAAGTASDKTRNKIFKIMDALSIRVIDTVPELRAKNNPAAYYTPLRVHPNERGYRAMASAILRGLRDGTAPTDGPGGGR